MPENTKPVPFAAIETRIHLIRGRKVMLDTDLAQLYGVATKNLNKAVERNRERFPEDFMCQLAAQEFADLRLNWNLNPPRRAALFALRLHPGGDCHAVERVAQPARSCGQHRNHACLCSDAGNAAFRG